jgi:hypothetical protein
MAAKRIATIARLTLAAAALLCLAPLPTSPLAAQLTMGDAHAFRDIHGTVTDGHEPLRGAIVELHNPATNAVTSRLTDATGHYEFKRQDGNADFTLSATYRGHAAHPHTISKFDSHLDQAIDFTIKTF